MSTITRIDVLMAQLPFRFAFGHALAERRSSENVYVKVTLDDGHVGFGEGVPRDYVTGRDGGRRRRRALRPLRARAPRPPANAPEDVPALLEDLRSATSCWATARSPRRPGAPWS